MSKSFDDVNNISIPTKETVAQLRKVFYSNEDNLIAAKEYASDLYTYYLEEDDSEQMLKKTKRELEYLHNKFPDDREIAEDYASCLSLWASSQSKSTIEKISKELLVMLRKFPRSRDIAEYYAEMLVYLAREETSADKCNAYWREIGHLKRCFKHSSAINEAYRETEQIINHLYEYILLSQRAQVYKEKYESNSCLKNAITYAESLCSLAEVEDDEVKSREYSETINSLVKKYPDCIDLIELQTGVIYNLATASQSYDTMRKASAAILQTLKKNPLNEKIAENYALSLEFLSEDEDNLGKIVRNIKEYHQLFPDNITITYSYSAVLSIYIEEQEIGEKENTLNLIWNLFVQNPELNKIYKDAFARYVYELPDENNRLFEFRPNYYKWLEKSIIKVDMNTGEVIMKFDSIIDACLKTGITPIDLLHSLEDNTKSENASIWFVP